MIYYARRVNPKRFAMALALPIENVGAVWVQEDVLREFGKGMRQAIALTH